MGHHTDSGCCATPSALEIAPDGRIVDLLFGGVVVIHRYLPEWLDIIHGFLSGEKKKSSEHV